MESFQTQLILWGSFISTMLLSLTTPHSSILVPWPAGPTLSSSQVEELQAYITDKEILDALHNIHINKSSVLDGFNSKFFISCWELVGKHFLKDAHVFLFARSFLTPSNTLLLLFPMWSMPLFSLIFVPYFYVILSTKWLWRFGV